MKSKKQMPKALSFQESSNLFEILNKTYYQEAYEKAEVSPLYGEIRCKKCGIFRSIFAFNKDKSRKNGFYPYCKDCRRPLLKKWAETYKEKHKEQSREWEINNRVKKLAHGAVKRAIKNGVLKQEPCLICGNINDVEAHHEDYTKKLAVIWLCPLHHKMAHSGAILIENIDHDCDNSRDDGCQICSERGYTYGN